VPGKAKAQVGAKGGNLDMPDLTALSGPIVVQLINNRTGACMAAGFDEPFKKRTDDQIKAVGGPAVVP
jgi:hypothetical protein